MDFVEILTIIVSPVVSVFIVFLGFNHTKYFMKTEKQTQFQSEVKKTKIKKTEEIVSSLFYLDFIIQKVFIDLSIWVLQTEESNELLTVHNRLHEGQNDYQIQLNKCKSYIHLYQAKFALKFEDYITHHDDYINVMVEYFLQRHDQDERNIISKKIKENSRYLSLELNNIIASIISDFKGGIE